MAVRIRLSRFGRKDRAFYRIGAFDSRSPRDGRTLEYLGWYDPLRENVEDQLKVNLERIEYWLSVGAQATPKTASLLKKAGVKFPVKVKKSRKSEKEKAAKKAKGSKKAAKKKAKAKAKS